MFDAYVIQDPCDIDQKRLPSPEPHVMVQEPEAESATQLPRPEYSNPNSSVTNIGVSSLSATSSESSETVADISAVFLPMREEVGDRTQIIDNGIDLQVELPTTDNLRTSQPLPPPADLPPELRYSNPVFSTPSVPKLATRVLAAPAKSVPAQFAFATVTPSLSRSLATFAERNGGHELDSDAAITPASTWFSYSKDKSSISVGQAEGYIRTRSVRPFLSVSKTDAHAL